MINETEFFNALRDDAGPLTQGQVDGVKRFLDATGDLDITWRAYILATVWHETGTDMQPVRETKAATDQKAVNILDAAFKRGQLPWVKTPYWRFDASGKSWLGRGDVQVTHKDNYAKASKYAGVDLVASPEKMLDPKVSVKVAVGGMVDGIFTGKALRDYLPGDYKGARRIINGNESAAKVAGYATMFEDAIRTASMVAPDAEPRESLLAMTIEALMGLWKK
ncbi:MAG: hypothetical protein E6R03_06440 [Hyphomicrobiaceae bacterium]|nr:MAG: hypothetical protein E6R03_06440 [Hyphomicrobiaceae bacterium]